MLQLIRSKLYSLRFLRKTMKERRVAIFFRLTGGESIFTGGHFLPHQQTLISPNAHFTTYQPTSSLRKSDNYILSSCVTSSTCDIHNSLNNFVSQFKWLQSQQVMSVIVCTTLTSDTGINFLKLFTCGTITNFGTTL